MSVEERELFALLRRLSLRGAVIRDSDGGYRLFSRSATSRGAPVDANLVREMLARGLGVEAEVGITVSAVGRTALRRRLATSGDEDFALQHRTVETRVIEHDSGSHFVTLNASESPLAWLRNRKGYDGRPMIDAAQFQAGERLRVDFTRGQMMPRITANWDASVADGRRGGGGLAELTDAALAARLRVEKAIDAVGPELGSVLIDFCCFLKGIEDMERARRWPARSAKLVLRLALSGLARHYGYATSAKGAGGSGVRHWGTEDYRPVIS